MSQVNNPVRWVEIRVPVSQDRPTGYQRPRAEVNLRKVAGGSDLLARIRHALDCSHARTSDGIVVQNNGQALRWIFEQLVSAEENGGDHEPAQDLEAQAPEDA